MCSIVQTNVKFDLRSASNKVCSNLYWHYYRILTYSLSYFLYFQLSEGNVLPPNDTPSSPLFPVVYRQHVYFFASENNREKFILSPFKYIHQAPPKPIIPVRLAIIGPPKSGKTTRKYGILFQQKVLRPRQRLTAQVSIL